MRRDDSEIIEIFDTDGPLVGNGFDATRLGESEFRGAATDDVDFQAAAETGGDVRRRRWVIPVGVTALVAVVAVGLTSGSDNQSVATPTTSGDSIAASPVTLATLPPTSAVAGDEGSTPAGASTPVGPAPRYVFDIPEGYAVAGVGEGSTGTADVTYSQLWASPDASRRSGAWVAITRFRVYDGDEQRLGLYMEDAYSLQIGSSTGIVTISAAPDAVGSVTLFRDDATLKVEGFGVSADDLVAVTEAIGGDATEPFPTSGAPEVLTGFTKLVDRAGYWRGDVAGPLAHMDAFGTEADPVTGQVARLSIMTTLPIPSYATVSQFLLDSITPFAAADGSIGIAGFSSSEPPRVQAYWVDHDGWAVTLNMDGGMSDVIAAAETAHVADDAEWNQNAAGSDTVFEGAEPFTDQAPVTTLTFGSGETVVVAVDLVGFEPDIQNSWSVSTTSSNTSGYGSYGSSVMTSCDVPRIAVLTSLQRTYVMANVPAGAVGATLVVTHDGGASMAVPLAELKPEFRVLGGVLTFEQVGPFTAVLTAADGSVLATWPTPPGL